MYSKLTHMTESLRDYLEEAEDQRLYLESCLEDEDAVDLNEDDCEDDCEDCYEDCEEVCEEDEEENVSSRSACVREAFEEFLQRQCADIMVEHSLGAAEALDAFAVLVEACVEASYVDHLPELQESEEMALWLAKAFNSPIACASHCISVEREDED